VAKKRGARLADFQYDGAPLPTPPKKRARRFDLAAVDPRAKPFSSGDKAVDQAAIDTLAGDIDRLQDTLYADRRFKVLVVLQGIDTSGKDGTIRSVFAKTSALGVRTAAFKAPTEEELAHDFLWRIHQKVPGAGEIAIFNRSHYEDVLVPVVKRLQARLDDPTKHWKFAPGDLEERKRWTDYQNAFADAIGATGTPWAPWTIVPADSKTHRNLMIATAVKTALEGLHLRYPPGDPALANVKVT
jgi:polyphosphate kinase 2 (PPK2 family)